MTNTTEYRTKGDTTVRYVEGVEDGLDFDAAYTADGYSGVAWRLQGWRQMWTQHEEWDEDEDGEPILLVDEGEWADDRTAVVAVMIGDDRFFVFDRDDVHPVPEDGFCHGCGQVGCTAEVWD